MEVFLLMFFILGASGLLIGAVFSSPVNATGGEDPQKEPRPDQWEDWETDRLNAVKAEDEEFWKAHYAADASSPPPPSVQYDTAPENPEYDSWLAEEDWVEEEEQWVEEEEQWKEEEEDQEY